MCTVGLHEVAESDLVVAVERELLPVADLILQQFAQQYSLDLILQGFQLAE